SPVRLEANSHPLDLSVSERRYDRAFHQQRLSIRKRPVEIREDVGGRHVGCLEVLDLSVPTGVEDTRNGLLEALWHLPLGVVRPVSVLDQSHQRAHQSYDRVLPPERSQSHDLRDVFDISESRWRSLGKRSKIMNSMVYGIFGEKSPHCYSRLFR